ncbi:MAG: methyltransferase domain-containing protein [Myxococcaceae bacterium]|nr:methyltransferase domain-containing protein [Myxococcaceae bacterium]
MKTRLSKHLRCPISREPLELVAWETFERPLDAATRSRAASLGIEPAELATEVQSGVLLSKREKVAFPIVDGVPRMITFRAGVVAKFDERFGERLRRELPGYALPEGGALEGEEEVLRTFSSEWTGYDWDGQTYWNLNAQTWFKAMDYVLQLEPNQLDGKLALEVGIGIGGVADHVCRSQGAEVVGMDLGYAVDVAYRHFGANPFLHIVQASAFKPPFAKQTFDFIYSFGVLHHTFSTKTAFDAVGALTKAAGRFFLWVYSPNNETRSLLRRALMQIENVARPVITKLPEKAQALALAPTIPVYMGWQALQVLRGNADVRYGVREAMHAARDRLTPKFAHRHTEDEVVGWFRENGFGALRRGSEREVPSWLPVGFLANTAVDGVRER